MRVPVAVLAGPRPTVHCFLSIPHERRLGEGGFLNCAADQIVAVGISSTPSTVKRILPLLLAPRARPISAEGSEKSWGPRREPHQYPGAHENLSGGLYRSSAWSESRRAWASLLSVLRMIRSRLERDLRNTLPSLTASPTAARS